MTLPSTLTPALSSTPVVVLSPMASAYAQATCSDTPQDSRLSTPGQPAAALTPLSVLPRFGSEPQRPLRERYEYPGIVVDVALHDVFVDGSPVVLTAREFALLVYFCDNAGRALSRHHLLVNVWGRRYSGGLRTVDVHVRRLRLKVGDRLTIETVRGLGYRLRPTQPRDALSEASRQSPQHGSSERAAS